MKRNISGSAPIGSTIVTLMLLLLVLGFMLFVFWDRLPIKDWLHLGQDVSVFGIETPTPGPSQTSSQTLQATATPAASVTTAPVTPYTPPDYEATENRVTYQDGFYYESVADIPQLMDRIRLYSYNETQNTKVGFDQLSYVRVKYVNFQNVDCNGEIICNKQIAQDIVEIFCQLYQSRYQIDTIQLVDNFGADDNASMAADNTSAFNYRLTTGSSTEISMHSYGLCIDINPVYNPYVYDNTIQPANSQPYVDRTADFPHKIDENDLCYQLFTSHGFTWGGSWNRVKDYQHFQKDIPES